MAKYIGWKTGNKYSNIELGVSSVDEIKCTQVFTFCKIALLKGRSRLASAITQSKVHTGHTPFNPDGGKSKQKQL